MSAYQLRRTTRASLATGLSLKPSWKVAYFLTGTSTPTPVYTTYERNVAHTQPVQANSGGILPPIYFDPSIVYKEEVYDENDVLQYTDDPVNDQLLSRDVIGAHLWPQTDLEDTAGITPDTSEAPGDVRRMGVVGDGLTDDTAALQKCFTVGGDWEIPPGFHIRTTATITGSKATRLFTNGPRAPGPDGVTQAYLLHDFDGTMFDLIGSAVNSEYNNGFTFEGLSFIQNHGNGSGESGVCIRNVATSDTQRCAWMRLVDCHFETVTGKNDWEWCVVIDGTANSGSTTQNRDHFMDRCRFVSGTNATGSVWLNGAKNVWIANSEANLANGILRITGTSSRTSGGIHLTATSFATIELDYVNGVNGAGNAAGTVTATANTQSVSLGCSCTSSDPTIAAAGTTVYGVDAAGVYTIWTANTVRFEMGVNVLECSGPIDTSESYKVDGTQVLSARITGWGAPTGTPTRTTFATGSVTLPQLAERVKALIDDLTTHGVIGS